jgi:hypothetical protein
MYSGTIIVTKGSRASVLTFSPRPLLTVTLAERGIWGIVPDQEIHGSPRYANYLREVDAVSIASEIARWLGEAEV